MTGPLDWFDDPNRITAMTYAGRTVNLCIQHEQAVLGALRTVRLGCSGTPNRDPNARCDFCEEPR